MTSKKNTKRALLMSVLSLLLCVSMLIGSTFAWFTDSVTSGLNKIQSGTLDIKLEHSYGYYDGPVEEVTATTELFKHNVDGEAILWEPGVSMVEYFTITNAGNLALKFNFKLVTANATATAEGKTLLDVLRVQAMQSSTTAEHLKSLNSSLLPDPTVHTSYELKDFGYDNYLLPGEEVVVAVHVMWEPTNNDNDYNVPGGLNLDLGVMLIATQYTYEKDSMDDQYDAEATLDYTPVSNASELKVALANKVENIVLTKNIETEETFNVDYDADINGAGFTISRTNGFTGTVFTVKANASLTIKDAIVDGGAVWSNTQRNSGVTATGNLIAAEKNAQIILNEGAVLQNNDGAHAVNLGTRIGATLTLNGGWIINNRSDSGAIWGGGHITVNEGSKINNNSSTGSAGAIRMVSSCNLTMNGGEICNNTAAASGGAIWGYGASVYNLKSGKMSGNTAATGGAIYTGDSSTINLSGDFEMCNNTANESGAMRLSNRTAFNMSGGKVAGNTSTNNSEWNGFYGWNPGVNISGGELNDDVCIQGGLTPKIGGNGINGVIHFDLSTNHNTAYLAADFGTFSFTVAEDANFNAFNLKPVSGYEYTDGDEAKLVCLNEGYSMYWDAATSSFRLQAK